MFKKLFFGLVVSTVLVVPVSAQAIRYKTINNGRLALAQSAKIDHADRARTVAQNFLNPLSKKDYSAWLKLLSEECFVNDSTPKKDVDKWWSELIPQKQQYTFTHEEPAVRTNQKILYYASTHCKNVEEKQLVMVKEHGQWKVFSMK